jgi:hypothetical protein
MKKMMVLSLALLLLAVAGCGKNATPGGNQGGGVNTPQAANPSGGGSNGTTTPGPSAGGNSTGNSTGTTPPSQTQTPKYEKKDVGPLKVGEVAKVGPLEVKIANIIVKRKAPGLPPNTTLAYVLVLINIKNTGTDDYPINLAEHFKFWNVEGKSYGFNTPATNTEQQRLTGTVKAGASVEGYLGYMAKMIPGTNKFVFQHPDWGTATWEYQS